jgi:gluconate kinase
MIYILFGEMGVGKNYVGERLAKHLECEFFDGDTVIPKPMAKKVNNFKFLSPSMIEDYIRNHLLVEIRKKLKGKDLVVAQALYRKAFRNEVLKGLKGEEVKLVYIPAPTFPVHMKRLLKRRRGPRWMVFCLMNKLFFQKPDKNTAVIENDIYSGLHIQIRKLINETT